MVGSRIVLGAMLLALPLAAATQAAAQAVPSAPEHGKKVSGSDGATRRRSSIRAAFLALALLSCGCESEEAAARACPWRSLSLGSQGRSV